MFGLLRVNYTSITLFQREIYIIYLRLHLSMYLHIYTTTYTERLENTCSSIKRGLRQVSDHGNSQAGRHMSALTQSVTIKNIFLWNRDTNSHGYGRTEEQSRGVPRVAQGLPWVAVTCPGGLRSERSSPPQVPTSTAAPELPDHAVYRKDPRA